MVDYFLTMVDKDGSLEFEGLPAGCEINRERAIELLRTRPRPEMGWRCGHCPKFFQEGEIVRVYFGPAHYGFFVCHDTCPKEESALRQALKNANRDELRKALNSGNRNELRETLNRGNPNELREALSGINPNELRQALNDGKPKERKKRKKGKKR